jgi:hypothetical protein
LPSDSLPSQPLSLSFSLPLYTGHTLIRMYFRKKSCIMNIHLTPSRILVRLIRQIVRSSTDNMGYTSFLFLDCHGHEEASVSMSRIISYKFEGVNWSGQIPLEERSLRAADLKERILAKENCSSSDSDLILTDQSGNCVIFSCCSRFMFTFRCYRELSSFLVLLDDSIIDQNSIVSVLRRPRSPRRHQIPSAQSDTSIHKLRCSFFFLLAMQTRSQSQRLTFPRISSPLH